MSTDPTRHRGMHPGDGSLFAPERLPILRQAVNELSWLLSRRYAPGAALKLVGDRHLLTARQRLALARSACADAARDRRARNRLPLPAVRTREAIIDGFNILVTLEAA